MAGWSGVDMMDNSAEILFPSFLQEALVSSSGHGQGCPLFDVVHPSIPLLTTSPTLKSALKDDFGQAVMLCDMPKPCTFHYYSSNTGTSTQKGKDVDLGGGGKGGEKSTQRGF